MAVSAPVGSANQMGLGRLGQNLNIEQNVATLLLSGAAPFQNNPLLLREQPWLPICYWGNFKIQRAGSWWFHMDV